MALFICPAVVFHRSIVASHTCTAYPYSADLSDSSRMTLIRRVNTDFFLNTETLKYFLRF